LCFLEQLSPHDESAIIEASEKVAALTLINDLVERQSYGNPSWFPGSAETSDIGF
jgi:hypothetical protein